MGFMLLYEYLKLTHVVPDIKNIHWVVSSKLDTEKTKVKKKSNHLVIFCLGHPSRNCP